MFDDFGQPRIDSFVNNDGWFDDTSDGPVMARLAMFSLFVQRVRYIDVEYPSWVVCASPAYVPVILNVVTMEDLVEDMAIRKFAERTDYMAHREHSTIRSTSRPLIREHWFIGAPDVCAGTRLPTLVLSRHLDDPLSARPVQLSLRHTWSVELPA